MAMQKVPSFHYTTLRNRITLSIENAAFGKLGVHEKVIVRPYFEAKEVTSMDIEHPDIERIERTGYPIEEYLEFEKENEMEEEEND